MSKVKIIKVLITLWAIWLVFKKDHVSNQTVIDGYHWPQSVYNEPINLYYHFGKLSKASYFRVFDLNFNPVDSVKIEAIKQTRISKDAYKTGYNYLLNGTYTPQKLKPGIYLAEYNYPIIKRAKPDSAFDIGIIIPLQNQNAELNFGGKSFYNYNSSNNESSDTLSFLREQRLDIHTIKFNTIINQSKTTKQYLSDYDLEDYTIFKNCKTLLFYGFVSYLSEKAVANINRYVAEGGHIICFAASAMNNICFFNPQKAQISVNKNHVNWYQLTDSNEILNTFGSTYFANYQLETNEVNNNQFKIIKNSNLFKGFNGKSFLIKSYLNSAPPLSYINKQVTTKKVDASNYVIYAYSCMYNENRYNWGTIIEYKKEAKSGKVINFGFTPDLNDSTTFENTKLLFLNAIEYLR